MNIAGGILLGFAMCYTVNESVTPGHLVMIGAVGLGLIAYQAIGPERLKAAAKWYWKAVTSPVEDESDLWW